LLALPKSLDNSLLKLKIAFLVVFYSMKELKRRPQRIKEIEKAPHAAGNILQLLNI